MANYDVNFIPNYIYFYHLDKFCILPTFPDSITDDLKSSFNETNALARTAPVFSYQNSGPRSMQITLPIHRDMLNGFNRDISNLKSNVVDYTDESRDYFDTLIKYLQAAALPRYKANSNSKGIIPPMVAVRFGDEIFIKGVVTSGVMVTYRKPVLENSKYAQAEVAFTVSETDPYDADTVVSEGSFRGIAGSFKNGIYKDTYTAPSINTDKINSSNNTNISNDFLYKNGYIVTKNKQIVVA